MKKEPIPTDLNLLNKLTERYELNDVRYNSEHTLSYIITTVNENLQNEGIDIEFSIDYETYILYISATPDQLLLLNLKIC